MSFWKRRIATVAFILSYCEFNSTQAKPLVNVNLGQQNTELITEENDSVTFSHTKRIEEPDLITGMRAALADPDSMSPTSLAKVEGLDPHLVEKIVSSIVYDLVKEEVMLVLSAHKSHPPTQSPPAYHSQHIYPEPYIEYNHPLPQHIPLYDPFNYEDERINNIYWQNKLDKLQEMIRDISSNEDDILMLLNEIMSYAPENYRYEAYNSFQSYNPRKKSLLDDELSLVYIPECLMYGSKSEEKEEVVIHFTSDPNLFHRVFRVVPIRERPKVSEASRIRREKQEAEYREQQRIHAEEYKAKERALKRANGEDMIFDPRVGKKVHFEDYLRSLFLSQLAETRSRAALCRGSKKS